jgi:DNA-directed RNA polymerase subunit alpha|uniref:RNA polymerase alpha subunit n=1 Tax=Tetraselmis suecica TaxID=270643 RepID=UPI0021D51E10|nr:RNA polymerase alpha subunit [Tetraselmis suecica]UXF58488.1 RNA polymerase alpha subunit [Tetraselmis suecica]
MPRLFFTCVESSVNDPKNTYARFKIGPFLETQTLTIANNLRRALLTELDGIAVVAVKIKGVSHEYSSLPGVKESVLDILLNIKQIPLGSAFQVYSPHLAYLNCQGPTKVTAKDIQLPPFLKCTDPDQYIATVCTGGYLKLVFLICPGKNYWLQLGASQFVTYCQKIFPKAGATNQTRQFIDETKMSESNILPIDATFMPINRVNYTIERDEEIDTELIYEYIFLEIWTNGTIHPFNAIKLALQSFIDIFKPLKNLKILQPDYISLKKIQTLESLIQTTSKGNYRQLNLASIRNKKLEPPVLNLDIGNLELSLRPYTCLKRANIQTIRDLMGYTREELLLLKNFGKKSLEELEKSLFKLGLFLPERVSKTEFDKRMK